MRIPEDMILKEGDALDPERDWIVDHIPCWKPEQWWLMVYDTATASYYIRNSFPTLEEAILYGEGQGSRLRIADFEIDLDAASSGIAKRFRGDHLPVYSQEAT